MLRSLHIQHLGVIADARLDLDPGLTVVTGETGAGKTMVVSGLGLVLGGKADTGLVRVGSEAALVEAELELPSDHPALAAADEAGALVEDGELVLSRSVVAEGRSRAHVGGRRAPSGVLQEIGRQLVVVHGQADQWRLTRPAHHRELLDAVAGQAHATCRAEVAELYRAWQAAGSELSALSADERARLRESDQLSYHLEQIDAVDPVAGEEESLRAGADRLAHAEQLQIATGTAHRVLSDPDGADGGDVVALIARAAAQLESVAAHDPALDGLLSRLREVGVLAADVAADLGAYASDVEVDPAQLAETQARQAAIADLLRRYGPDLDAVLAYRDEARERLGLLAGADARIAELQAQVAELGERLVVAVDRLSASRAEAGQRLAAAVTAELSGLGMASAVVEVLVRPMTAEAKPAQPTVTDETAASTEEPGGMGPDGRHVLRASDGRALVVTADGVDQVEIQIAANPGAPPRSVARAASGGELSRLMLAIEVATADEGGGGVRPTFVFDEVDAGIGGRAGLDVGARLARLARTHQVLVVTHLAQVAAHADRHLVVHKTHDDQVTSSDVRVVEGEEQVAELARMMGGGGSAAALEHARELRETCRAAARG